MKQQIVQQNFPVKGKLWNLVITKFVLEALLS